MTVPMAHLAQLPSVEELDRNPKEEDGMHLEHVRDRLLDAAECRMGGLGQRGVDPFEIRIGAHCAGPLSRLSAVRMVVAVQLVDVEPAQPGVS